MELYINNLLFTEIAERRLTFLQFVESLEGILTSSDKNIRLNGVNAFVSVLKNLPLDFFESKELEFINQFLCERFIDHHSFVPIILVGIEYTVRIEFFDGDEWITKYIFFLLRYK